MEHNDLSNPVLLPMNEYDHLPGQVEDEELSKLAEDRLADYDRKSVISHEAMKYRFRCS